jgi:hypothetical protein
LYVPNVSVKVEIASLSGSRLDFKGGAEAVSFNVKAKLEEKERKSQTIIVGFGLLVTAKPAIVKFEIEGTATLTGKDEDIRKLLEVDPETKIPRILPRVYQHAFTAMYLLSTVLDTPPPPNDLLGSQQQNLPEDLNVEVETPKTVEPAAPQPAVVVENKSETVSPSKPSTTL